MRTDALSTREPLLEREGELATLEALVDAVAQGEGGAVAIDGQGGIGKTRLLAEAVGRARDAGITVLEARASELEREFAFGVVRQLFEPALSRASAAERRELTRGAARLAGPLLTGDPVEREQTSGRDTYAVLHSLFWLVANLSAHGPLVIAVDDAHWADAPSLRFFGYLVNRVRDLPVLVVMTRRAFEPGADILLLDEVTDTPTLHTVRPAPLGAEAVDAVVRASFADPADPLFVKVCRDATKGNPLLLRELLLALRAEGVAPTAEEAGRVLEVELHTVGARSLRRLQRLPPDATLLARAIAVLGERADDEVATELAGLDASRAAAAAFELARAGIFAAGAFEFEHPILRRAVYSELVGGRRSEWHSAAARCLAERGAEDDEVAVHLLSTDPGGDQRRVELLRSASTRALSCGAPDIAATYLRRALAEPPRPESRPELLFGLGLAKAATSDPTGFADLRAAMDATAEPHAYATMALKAGQAYFGWGDFRSAAEVARAALLRLPPDDAELAAQLEAQMIGFAFLDRTLLPEVEDRLTRLSHESDSITDPTLLATTAVFATARWEEFRGGELADRALKSPSRSLLEDILTFGYAANALMTAGRLQDARRAWDRLVGQARRSGSPAPLRFVSSLRAYTLVRLGALAAAEADSQVPAGLPDRFGAQLPFLLAPLVDVLIERGDLDAAEKVVEPAQAGLRESSMFQTNYLLDSLGRLRLAQGRSGEAVEHLRECGHNVEGWRLHNPGVLPWRVSLALALAGEGELEEALELAQAEIALARKFAVTRELGMALRAAALASSGRRRLTLMTEAVAVLDRSQALLERARALVDLGATLRSLGHRADARDPLRRGLGLATECGATALVERAHGELVASGARPRRLVMRGLDALTASERRVAELAADGLTNREIAETLFLSEKTVEGHLGQVYRKLGIRVRSQLPRSLRHDDTDGAKPSAP
jgi:DNA-binding CsgD family transcriptional regulator